MTRSFRAADLLRVVKVGLDRVDLVDKAVLAEAKADPHKVDKAVAVKADLLRADLVGTWASLPMNS